MEHGAEHNKWEMHKYLILVDSDAFVGLLNSHDAHHQQVASLFGDFAKQALPLVTTNLVIGETATVLSKLHGQELARKFLDLAETFPSVYVTEEQHKEALNLFREQSQKRTSYVDCANATVMRRLSIPMIFSFDKVYTKKFGLRMAAE